ncbi:MAG: peptidase S41 [Bacteroidales bacterium]|nr:MAG: peptidase S41 [Bacteroidales bacterium]
MNHIFKNQCLLIVLIVLLSSCASVKKYNNQINTLKSEEQLKADVDYIHQKLQKLHPRLYWYIRKKDLDYKFDSLKATITDPMTSNDFFFKLSPVISSVKQGHLRMSPLTKKLSKKENRALNRKGVAPLLQFSYEIFDNKLYIVKNSSSDTTIKVGSEIISMNSIEPQEIISKLKNTFTSDGYNQTFINRGSCWMLPNFFYLLSGEMDSVKFELRYCDSLTNVTLVRGKNNGAKVVSQSIKKTSLEKKQAKNKAKVEARKKKRNGYNSQTKTYSKNLNFTSSDNSIAIMKLNDFSRGDYKKFYRNSFKKLDSLKTKTLIIDLRDNPGGRLKEINNLYSYLTDSSFYFVEKMEVTTRTSLILGNYTSSTPLIIKALNFTIGLPFLASRLAKVKKVDNKFYYNLPESKLKHRNPINFKGKVYVLINGGSFSASSIISSNLKGSKRAVFVGEETGGAYNGCIAGTMPVFTLPQSKLRVRFGLGAIIPFHKTDMNGRGILPDVEIKPTIDDRIKGIDPELNWVLDDIKGLHISK